MIKWEFEGGDGFGESDAGSWDEAILDISEALGLIFKKCAEEKNFVISIEMWPDTGRMIFYPAISTKAVAILERRTEPCVQLAMQFWRDAWFDISLNRNGSETSYFLLKEDAIGAIRKAYEMYQIRNSEFRGINLYVSEFEGSEGFVVLAGQR